MYPRVALIILCSKTLHLPCWTIWYWGADLFKCNLLKLIKLLGWYFNLLLSIFWKFWTSCLQIFSLTVPDSHTYLYECYVSLAFEDLFIFLHFFVCFLWLYALDKSMYEIVSYILFFFILLLLTIKCLLKIKYLLKIFYKTHFKMHLKGHLSTNSEHCVHVMHICWRFFFIFAIGLWLNADFLKCSISLPFSLCKVIFYRYWSITSTFW